MIKVGSAGSVSFLNPTCVSATFPSIRTGISPLRPAGKFWTNHYAPRMLINTRVVHIEMIDSVTKR
jgi:hypothetical protein